MELNVHAVHFDADSKLEGFLKQKLTKLETFYDRLLRADVFLKLNKTDKINKLHEKIVEVKIQVPQGEIFVTENGKTFETAIDLAMESLKSQIKKFKDKKRDRGSIKQTAEDLSLVDDDY
jgi:putative sigma-54 modulation protein